jgi:hypothetical protein
MLPTGDLRADLRELIDRNLAYLAEPATRAALPALLPEIEANERVFALFARRDQDFRGVIRAVLQRAASSGNAPAHAVGKEEIVMLILSGTTFNIAFAPASRKSEGIVGELLDTLLAAILSPAGIPGEGRHRASHGASWLDVGHGEQSGTERTGSGGHPPDGHR